MASPIFNGVRWPKIMVLAGLGGTADPGGDYLHLGVGPGLGTGKLGGITSIDIADDVRSISIHGRGRDSPIDTASPATCTIVFGNASGDYDPSNLFGPYVSPTPNQLSRQNSTFDLASGGVGDWINSANATLARTSTVTRSGPGALAVTAVASLDTAVECGNSAGTRVPVTAGDTVSVRTCSRAATVARAHECGVNWFTAGGAYVSSLSSSTDPTDATTDFETTAAVTGVAPPTATQGSVYAKWLGPAAGEVHYLDDVSVVFGTEDAGAQGPASLIEIGTPIKVRVERPLGTTYDRFTGLINDVAVDVGTDPTVTITCADALESLGRTSLTTITPSYDLDMTGARVGHILDSAAFASLLRSVDTGYTRLGPTIYGKTALELLREVEQTEFGLLFVDGAGNVIFYDRHRASTATRSTTVQAWLTDLGDVTDLGMATLETARSRDGVYNDIHITRAPDPFGEDEPVEQVATDATSVARYGQLNLPAEVGQLHVEDYQTLAMAQALLLRFAQPRNRVRTVRVNALRGDLWATLLPLGLLDLIGAYRDYSGVNGEAGNVITAKLHIQAMDEDIEISPPRWELTLATSEPPPPPDLWILGTSAIGTGALGW